MSDEQCCAYEVLAARRQPVATIEKCRLRYTLEAHVETLTVDAGVVRELDAIRAALRGDVAEPLDIIQDSPLSSAEVGVRLCCDPVSNTCIVEEVFPGSCVDGELIPGDCICAIDGCEVTQDNVHAVIQKGGGIGSRCDLTVERDGARFLVSLTRVSSDELNERAGMLAHIQEHHALCSREGATDALMKSAHLIQVHYLRQERLRMAQAQRITKRLGMLQGTVLNALTRAEAMVHEPAGERTGVHLGERFVTRREGVQDWHINGDAKCSILTKSINESEDLYGIGLVISRTFPFLVLHGTTMVDAVGVSLVSTVHVGDELLAVDDKPVHEVSRGWLGA